MIQGFNSIRVQKVTRNKRKRSGTKKINMLIINDLCFFCAEVRIKSHLAHLLVRIPFFR